MTRLKGEAVLTSPTFPLLSLYIPTSLNLSTPDPT